MRSREIDVAHIDHSLTYRENCQLLQKQFGVEFVKSNNAKLDRAEMLARMYHAEKKPEKARKDPYIKPAEKRPLFAPTVTPISLDMPFDPIKRSREMEKLVMRDHRRLAYKFRYQRFYGGIATCDCIGCNLLCAYCWNYDRNLSPGNDRDASFCSPLDVAERLEKIAGKRTDIARISGCEPFLGAASTKWLYDIFDHSDLFFVIETNGIMLGAQPALLDCLKRLRNIRIRLALKASNGLEFEKITGCNAVGYGFQIAAIREIQKRHIPLKVAYMPEFVDPRQIDVSGYILEEEGLKYYAGTKARIAQRGMKARPKA